MLSEHVISSMSLIEKMNKTGERGSPCFTPVRMVKKLEHLFLYLTQDLILSHIEKRALSIILLQPFCKSFCHKSALSTVSNAF